MQLLPYVDQQLQKVLQMMAIQGRPMKVASAYRSFDAQDELYAQGRTKPGKVVTNAKGGYSWHNYHVAVDCCFIDAEPFGDHHPWALYGQTAKRFGFEWGGDWDAFQDRPHIQMTFGENIETLAYMGEKKALDLLTKKEAKKEKDSKVSDWAEVAVKKASALGIINNWSDPQALVDPDMVLWVFYKLGAVKNKNMPMTRERFAVALDNLNLLK